MSFSFGGAKPPTTGAPAATTGGFSFGAAPTGAAGTGGFSFGAAPKTTAPAAPGGFSFGAGLGGTPAAPQAQVAPAAPGGFSFGGTPSAGVAQAPTTTGGGFSLGGGTALGGTSALGAAPPSYNAAQTAAGGGFSLGGVSALGAPKTQAAPAAGFSLGGTPSMAAAPGTITSGFSLGGTPSLGGATSIAGAPQAAPGGFKLSGTAAPVSTAAATTAAPGGFKLGGATTAGGLGLGGGLGGAGLTTASATPGLTSILKSTGTAAPTTKTGLALTMPAKSMAAPAATGLSLGGLGAKPTTTAGVIPTASAPGAAAPTTGPKMSYQELEHAINKWTVELEDQEKTFLKQATQVNAWDRLLIENGEKITSLHNDMEKVKADQQRLEHELDYIVAQQRELEDMLVPLEETVATQQQGSIYTQHADLERERTYQLAENTDGQLKRMVQDLKDIIDHLNTANTPLDTNDPMNQIAKILNAHMDSLQWIDQNTVMLGRKVDEVAKQCDVVRRDQERNVHLAFD